MLGQRLMFLASLLLATTASAAEDPRMDQAAEVVATICGNSGCRTINIAGPVFYEPYGSAEHPIYLERRLTVRSCNQFLTSSLGFVMVQAWIGQHVLSSQTVRKIVCRQSDVEEV